MNDGSDKSQILSFICKNVPKKDSKKITPSSSKMQRTISIHHLECNDFISTNELYKPTSESKALNFALDLHENNISKVCESAIMKTREANGDINAADDGYESVNKLGKTGNELVDEHIVLKEKLIETRDSLLRQKGTNPKVMKSEFLFLSKLFLDTLDSFNANREAIIDAFEDANYFSPGYLQALQDHADKKQVNKSHPLPGLEYDDSAFGGTFASHKRLEMDSSINLGPKFEHEKSSVSIVGVCSNSVPDSHQLRKQREAGTVLNGLMDFKQRIKNIIKNKQEKHRISRDGILHKVPFGHKLAEGQEEEVPIVQHVPAFAGCKKGEGIKFNGIPPAYYGRCVKKRIQRSHSLTESLGRYSQLLESLSGNEQMMAPKLSKSIQEYCSFGHGRLLKKFGRILSSTELRSYSFKKDIQSNALQSSKMSTPKPLGSEMEVTGDEQRTETASSTVVQVRHKNLDRTLSTPVFRSFSFSEDVHGEVCNVSQSFKTSKISAQEPFGSEMEPTFDKANTNTTISHTVLESVVNLCGVFSTDDTLGSALEGKIPDRLVMPTVERKTEMVACQQSPRSMGDCEHVIPYIVSVVKEENDTVSEQKTQAEAETDVQSTQPSFIPSLNSNMEQDTNSLALYEVPEDPELQAMFILPEEQRPPSDSGSSTGYKEKRTATELSMSERDGPGMAGEFGDPHSLYVNNDRKHDNIFKFVRHMLRKPGYNVMDGRPGVSSSEFWSQSCAPRDEPVEQVLRDLLDEVLLQFYENSCAPNPWLLRFHSKIRWMPSGDYLLTDAWSEIKWRLYSPQGLDVTLDDLVSYDFAKEDGWMNIYRDAECVGVQLEHLIWDDLVYEIIVGEISCVCKILI